MCIFLLKTDKNIKCIEIGNKSYQTWKKNRIKKKKKLKTHEHCFTVTSKKEKEEKKKKAQSYVHNTWIKVKLRVCIYSPLILSPTKQAPLSLKQRFYPFDAPIFHDWGWKFLPSLINEFTLCCCLFSYMGWVLKGVWTAHTITAMQLFTISD